MAWELLPENFTDREWEGLQKYREIENGDGTISFQDVTEYTNDANSFFGALEANRIDQAVNILMSMVESGTNIYEEFLTYFNTQKGLFEDRAQETIDGVEQLLEDDFLAWYERMKDQLSEDAAGRLQVEIDNVEKRKQNNEAYVNYTFLASGWSNNVYSLESIYPSNDYDITGIYPNSSTTQNMKDAWGSADCAGYEPTNVVRAHQDAPTIDITMTLAVRYKSDNAYVPDPTNSPHPL